MALGLGQIQVSADYRSYFSADDPDLLAYQELEHAFSATDYALIAVQPADADLTSIDTLQLLHGLTEALWTLPHSQRVDSLVNHAHIRADGEDVRIEPLFDDPETLDSATRHTRLRWLQEAPSTAARLVSQDGRTAGIQVAFRFPEGQPDQAKQLSGAALQQTLDRFRAAHPDHRIALTGSLVSDVTLAETARADSMRLYPLMVLLVVAVLYAALRSLAYVGVILAVVGASLLSALGTVGWFAPRFTPDVAAATAMVLPLAIADCIHIVSSYLQHPRVGEARPTAMQASLAHNRTPVLLTSLTTAVGFLSLTLSSSPPIQWIGVIVALGVGFACLFSLAVLPRLILRLPVPVRRSHQRPTGALGAAEHLILHHPRWISTTLLVLGVAASTGVARNQLNDTLIDFFDPALDFRADSDWIDAQLTGVSRLEWSVPANGPEGVFDPDYLNHLAGFAAWLRDQPEVAQVAVVSDTITDLHRELNGGQPQQPALPQRRDLIAQYFLLYEMSLPFGLDPTHQVNLDKSASRVGVSLHKTDSESLRRFAERASERLARQAPDSMAAARVSGPDWMFATLSHRNFSEMMGSTLVVLVAISVLMVAVLRSWRLGALSFCANLLPGAAAFGLWGFVVGEVGITLSTVMGMTLGIVVDDSIHLLTHYRRQRAKGRAPEEAVRHTLRNVGQAVTLTTASLVPAFWLLTVSDFKQNIHLGWMTALIIALAWIIDLFILMPLLLWRTSRPAQARPG